MTEHPRVFISYSHDSQEHKNWVLELATNMREHGVDVILDQWDLSIGKDLRFFMEKGLDKTDFVLCVCSSIYVQKADDGIGGVGYESTIISRDLLVNSNTENVLPVIKNNSEAQKTSKFLLNKIYSNFDTGNYYDEYRLLLEKIYGEDSKKKPALGNSPFQNKMASDIQIKNDLDKSQYISIENDGVVQFDYSKNDGIYTLGQGELSFDTTWSGCSSDCIYAYSDNVKLVGYIPDNYDYPSEQGLLKFDYTSRVVKVHKNEIVVFQNKFGNFVAVKVLDIKSKSHGEELDYLNFEYRVIVEPLLIEK